MRKFKQPDHGGASSRTTVEKTRKEVGINYLIGTIGQRRRGRMKRMAKFMVVHNDPHIKWETVQQNWRKLGLVEEAKWDRTFFNSTVGVRYCLWIAPGRDKLEKIFKDLSIAFESIIEVKETLPDMWGENWQKHLEEEQQADTLAF